MPTPTEDFKHCPHCKTEISASWRISAGASARANARPKASYKGPPKKKSACKWCGVKFGVAAMRKHISPCRKLHEQLRATKKPESSQPAVAMSPLGIHWMHKRKCPRCHKMAGVCLVCGATPTSNEAGQSGDDEIVSERVPADPDCRCLACSYKWRARPAKTLSTFVFTIEMLETLRAYGLPALIRISEAKEFAGRLAPMGVFRGWVKHFGLPQSAVDPAFALTKFWRDNPEAGRQLEIPRAILMSLDLINQRAD